MKMLTSLFTIGIFLRAVTFLGLQPSSASLASSLSCETTRGEDALYEALHSNDVASVRNLLKQRINLNDLYQPPVLDVHATACHAAPFLYWALLFRCRPEILNLLVASGADVGFRFREPEDVTLLMLTAYAFPAASVRFLLDHGAPVNARTRSGRTALMIAVTDGNPELGQRDGARAAENAALLISYGAGVDLRDGSGMTAVMVAARNYAGSDAALKVLLAHGARVNATDASGATALMYASEPANLKAVKRLLHKGADVKACDRRGHSALMYALYPHCSKCDLLGVITLLCHVGVKINARDRHGNTALDYATGWEERVGSAVPILQRLHAVHGTPPFPHAPTP